MLLILPNNRLVELENIHQHSKDTKDMQEVSAAMRGDDAEHTIEHGTPLLGTTAFTNAIKAQAQLLWAQRSKDSSKPPNSGQPASNSKLCF